VFQTARPTQDEAAPEKLFIAWRQDLKRRFSKPFRRWRSIQDNGFMLWQRFQEIDHDCIATIHQEGVIPRVNNGFMRDAFDFAKIEHHAIVACCFIDLQCTCQR